MPHGSEGFFEFDSQDFTSFIQTIDVPTSFDEPETTTLQPTGDAKTFEPGLESGTISIAFVWSAALIALLASRKRLTAAFRYAPQGDTTGLRQTTGSAFFTAIGQATDVNNIILATVDFRITGIINHIVVP